MRALIVDDARAMRSILGKLLVGMGFEIFSAGNGQEALEQLEANEAIEVVLVDWNMPTMNGLQFVEEVRGREEYNEIQLVMCTTETDPGLMKMAMDCGANEYIVKPFSAEVLKEKLRLVGVC